MAEDQTQQTRVLVINGQTVIVQGGIENNSLSEINTDLIQQALQEVSDGSTNVGQESNTYITPDTHVDDESNNNIVGLAILQAEQGEPTTIQLTAEQAEALGLSFTNGEPSIKAENSENVGENMLITDGSGRHFIYTDGTLKTDHGFVFDTSGNNNEACTKMVPTQNDNEDDSVDVQTGAEPLGVLSTPVSAFLGDSSNQPLSLIPQIVNGQVTYTVKIHDDGGKVLAADQLEGNTDFIGDSVQTNTIATSFQQSDSDNITSYVTTSVPTLSYGSSVATPVSIQTLAMGDYQTQNMEPGSILTDSQTNISYVILPSTSTSDEAAIVTKPSIPVQQVPSFVPFSSIASSQSSASDAQGTGIGEVYSTVTAVDTSGEAATQVRSPTPSSVMSIPIASVSSEIEPVVSGTLSSVTGSLAGGLIRVVSSSDRSLLQPNMSGGKFTSILSSTGQLIPSVTSVAKGASANSASSKPASINCAAPKITVTYPRPFSGVTKVSSLLTTASSTTQSTPVTTVSKIIESRAAVSGASVLSSGTLTSGTSILSTQNSGTTKSSTVHTAPSVSKSLSNILASKVVSSSSTISPRIITVSSQTRTSSGNLAPKIVTASTSGSKVVTVNSTVPKIITVNTSSGIKTASDSVSSVVSATLSKIPPAKSNSNKPLGSSENPIQLVQHGQTFHSMQSLSESQLRQIATVLQQQNLDATSRSKNVLYDAETKTRIIYRVVYPEDLDIGDPGSPSDTRPLSRGRGRRGRPPKSGWRAPGRGYDSRSVDLDLDEDRLLDDSSKGERKKQLARTRSGRLSRPPRHMVKDYKRLHHLDFADADLDDSDGGYSDYQMSEHEELDDKPEIKDKELLPGLVLPKRKISSHFRCPTCQKIYLGHSRMARHFEAFPDHGSIEQIQVPPVRSETKPDLATLNGMMRPGPGRRRGKRRGPWAYLSPEVRSQRRKMKLKEMLGTYSAEELAEVCGPMVAGLLPLWELLLLRVDAVHSDDTYLATLLEEVQAVLERLQAIAKDVLRPTDHPDSRRLHKLELQDKIICALLDVPRGTYAVDDRCLRVRDQDSFEGEPFEKRSKLMDEDEDGSEVDEKPVGSRKDLNIDARVTNFSLDTEVSERHDDQDDERSDVKVDDAEEEGEYLLQSSRDVDDMDAAAESDELSESINTSSQSFSDPDQNTKALQAVDEIVNESLKNLEFGVDDMVHAPQQRNTSHQENKCEKDATSKYSVPSFDAEIALAAMGDGCRTSCNLETLDNITDSKTLYCSQDGRREKGGMEASKGHNSFVSSHLNNMANNVKFKNEPDLTSCMPEHGQDGEPFSANITMHPASRKSAVHTGEDQNLSSRTRTDKHDYTNHLHHLQSAEGETYDPELALRAMGEGDQPVSPSKVNHLEYSPTIKMEVSEGEGTPTYVLTGIVEVNDDDSEVTQEHFRFHQEVNENSTGVDFATELALNTIKEECETGSTEADRENSGSYIPEMVLVVGKEEEDKPSMDHGPAAYHAASAGESQPIFGPELADVSEGSEDVKPPTYELSVNPLNTRPFQSSIGSLSDRQFQLQCGSEPDFMEVSLDESGPELDFEALSEEFNQNTRHS